MDISARPVHTITLQFYTLDDLRRLIEERCYLILGDEVKEKIDAGARFVAAKSAEEHHIYGVNTGFGALCETRIAPKDMKMLQHNHILSHACGVGENAPEIIVRLAIIIKILTFRTGHTGITVRTVNCLLDLLNNDIIPAVPKKGTVGASGDLAPLAHIALPLLGMGQVYVDGQIKSAQAVLDEMGWEPIELHPKEGLALTNGVQYINAFATHSLIQIEELLAAADVVAAMSIQGFSAAQTFYEALYHETTYHQERRTVAANLRKLLAGSNHFELQSCSRSKQDPYSFRCIPQVHGAIRQTFHFARTVIEQECNSVSDNPLFFPEQDQILFGGNLHGESTAFALDFLAIALSELANISERRTYQLLSGKRELPDFLVAHPGLNSGYMVVQYTAAALVNQNKIFAIPSSIDSIPTCQHQEDHVSMGGTSAYKLEDLVRNSEYVLSIELLTAAQAINFNKDLVLSRMTKKIFQEFRKEIGFLDKDRVMSGDMENARKFLNKHRRFWYFELSN